MLSSIVGDQQNKRNFDYNESFADFNDCVNQAKVGFRILKNRFKTYNPHFRKHKAV